MKPVLACTLALAALAAASHPAAADDTAALAAAQSWMTAMTAAEPAPAASKKKPLDYVVVADSAACKALKVGKAADGKGTAKLQACLVASQTPAADGNPKGAPEFKVVTLPSVTGFFPTKYVPKMKTAAKGGIVAELTGEDLEFQLWVVIGADNRVRAVWMLQADS